ncbi:hypothetical protein DL95DRAFT_430279 [Leptodontidium sp. 2 PMI_412]|nr:hypothetical protein DL95DRAFT_430279 [Leptodontidium sp. 2 PMI_412]
MFASHFSVANIPYGIASSTTHSAPSLATRIEDTVIFLDELAKYRLLSSLPPEVIQAFSEPTLNTFTALPKHVLNAGEAVLKKRFLPPGFLHYPVGYTARTSSIIVSKTLVTRPKGQFRDVKGEVVYGPTQQLDYELEMGCIIGKPNKLRESIAVNDTDKHIFRLVEARDIQGLEMIITLDALQSFQCPTPPRELKVAPYLADSKTDNTYSIQLKAELVISDQATTIYKSKLETINSCNLNTGDILATRTISGETRDSHRCLLELTKGGEASFRIKSSLSRKFLEDGDSIRISASCGNGVGFREYIGKVLPAR